MVAQIRNWSTGPKRNLAKRETFKYVKRVKFGSFYQADESVIALANNCLHLRSLRLYYCQNITDRTMYALVHSLVKNKHEVLWGSVKIRYEEESLMNLNINQCTPLTPPAVQALCDSFSALHTRSGRYSLVISGCLNLTSVSCPYAFQSHQALAHVCIHGLLEGLWMLGLFNVAD